MRDVCLEALFVVLWLTVLSKDIFARQDTSRGNAIDLRANVRTLIALHNCTECSHGEHNNCYAI